MQKGSEPALFRRLKFNQLRPRFDICYSRSRMKMFSRVKNSVVMTAALLAVIIGSLCFSAGEGLRLTPFPNPTFSTSHDAADLNDAGTISELAVAKYGPLDVPTRHQKRGNRHTIDLASASVIGPRSVLTGVVSAFSYEAGHNNSLAFIASRSGRAPPFQS